MHLFLIDECLTPVLAYVARRHGYEATTVRQCGLGGKSDALIADAAVGRGWLMVTNNGRDYLRLYRSLIRHPGLLIIRPSGSRRRQTEMFERLLEYLHRIEDISNHTLTYGRDGVIDMRPWHADPSGTDET